MGQGVDSGKFNFSFLVTTLDPRHMTNVGQEPALINPVRLGGRELHKLTFNKTE